MNEDWYTGFDKAFTAIHFLTALCYRRRYRSPGRTSVRFTYGACYSSSLISLGLMNVTFDIRNRMYRLIGVSVPYEVRIVHPPLDALGLE